MDVYIVSDIGGTQIRVAAYNSRSVQLVNQQKIPTQGYGQLPIDRIMALIETVTGFNTIKAISFGVPGFLDLKNGVIRKAPNVPGWTNFPIRQILQERFQVPVFMNNDANLAALAEWKYGAGMGHKNLLYLTISTGIGSGVIVNETLLEGADGIAAELGHVTILPEGPLCGCGHRGHLEALSSGTAIRNFIVEQINNGRESILNNTPILDGKDIVQAAKSGDSLAIEAYQRAGKYLGIAIANFLHIFNPSIVVLGGGVIQAGELLFNPMNAALLESIVVEEYVQNLSITTATLGDDVGLRGALALLLMNLPQEPNPIQ